MSAVEAEERIENLALRRAMLVDALHDALVGAVERAAEAIVKVGEELSEQLQSEVHDGVLRTAESSVWNVSSLTYLTSGRVLSDDRPREAYVQVEYDTDEEGCWLTLSTRLNTGGRTDRRTKRTVSIRYDEIRSHALTLLSAASGTRDQLALLQEGQDYRMWETRLLYLDVDNHDAIREAAYAHFLALPAVVKAYEEAVEEAMSDVPSK